MIRWACIIYSYQWLCWSRLNYLYALRCCATAHLGNLHFSRVGALHAHLHCIHIHSPSRTAINNGSYNGIRIYCHHVQLKRVLFSMIVRVMTHESQIRPMHNAVLHSQFSLVFSFGTKRHERRMWIGWQRHFPDAFLFLLLSCNMLKCVVSFLFSSSDLFLSWSHRIRVSSVQHTIKHLFRNADAFNSFRRP